LSLNFKLTFYYSNYSQIYDLPEIPEWFFIRVESAVFSGVLVAAEVAHPNVVTGIGQDVS
jgi:hypothetical protein